MYFLSFLGGSCGHIRCSLCMMKYPSSEGDGYIYKKNKPGGCHALSSDYLLFKIKTDSLWFGTGWFELCVSEWEQ